jgi:hypothetical protein
MTKQYIVEGISANWQRAINRGLKAKEVSEARTLLLGEGGSNERSNKEGNRGSGGIVQCGSAIQRARKKDLGCLARDIHIAGAEPAQENRIPSRLLSEQGTGTGVGGRRECLAVAETSDKGGVPAVVDNARLTDKQSAAGNARAALLRYADRLVKKGATRRQAYKQVAKFAKSGCLREGLQSLVAVANARPGGGRALSASTLRRWRELEAKTGTLAPAIPQRCTEKPSWNVELFRKYYGLPSKLSVRHAIEMMARECPESLRPSVEQAGRYLERLGAVERNRGRMTGSELRALKPFVKRGTEYYAPMEIAVVDRPGVRTVSLANPAADIECEPGEAPWCESVTVTLGDGKLSRSLACSALMARYLRARHAKLS